MKPRWKSQPGFIDIRSSLCPTEDYPLSGVVLFKGDKDTGFFYVTYDYKTVEAIARKMPYGIGPDDPAYLLLTECSGRYQLYCKYYESSTGTLLWEQEGKPQWCRAIHRA